MINYERIYKDVENDLIYGSGFIESIVYEDRPNCYYKITASEETLNFSYEVNGFEVIKTSVPYEMFWEPEDVKEILPLIMETIIKIGRKAGDIK